MLKKNVKLNVGVSERNEHYGKVCDEKTKLVDLPFNQTCGRVKLQIILKVYNT